MEREDDLVPGLDAVPARLDHTKVQLIRRPSEFNPYMMLYAEQCSCGFVTLFTSRRGAEVMGKAHRKGVVFSD